MNSKKIFSFLLIGICFFFLKLFYSFADNADLALFLRPIDFFISIFYNSDSNFTLANGYYHPDLGITIDKSCSGFNFWMMCFTLFGFQLHWTHSDKIRWLTIIALLPITYFFSLLANISRILISIQTSNLLDKFQYNQNTFFHETQGIFIFLLFFISYHFIITFFLRKFYANPN